MITRLEERIGGHLQPEILHQVFEEMRDAPVKPASQMLAHRLKPVLEVLDDEQQRPVIWNCLKVWLEVLRRLYTWTQALQADTGAGSRQRDEDRTTPGQKYARSHQELGRITGRFRCMPYTAFGAPDVGAKRP